MRSATTEAELESFQKALLDSLERVSACLVGLTAQQLNWRPPAPEANSLYVLASHIMGNIEENVLAFASGLPSNRDRPAEFVAQGEAADALIQRAGELAARVQEAVGRLSLADLDVMRTHPRFGQITAREVLMVPVRHAAEHIGQMELTRDLAKAAGAS